MACGILVIDKPEGLTSHDVVGRVRRLLKEKRVGHAGTLDPMATGVLPVFAGRATRAVEFAADGEKEYLAGLKLGTVTDTQDTTGTVLSSAPAAGRAALEAVLSRFTGPIFQVPPMYSAIKLHGKKLYELARKGIEVERAPRPVTIHAIELQGSPEPDVFLLRVRCSKGTYIRTLCHDIGAALGCGGCMCSLRRTMAAGFDLSRAVTLDALEQAAAEDRAESMLMPVEAYFARYPSVTVSGSSEFYCRNGNPFPLSGADGTYRVFGEDGEFLMLGRLAGGEMSTIKSFFAV